ncbi:MAG: hypothetical protein HZA52_09205 [Planctomycetes bacterium]|nr:hypothetical protein [Planctomycetota bacterium]
MIGRIVPGGALRALAVAWTLFLLPACATTEPLGSLYVHPNADWSNYQRVAVLPLENLTNERYAAERVREVLNVELNAQGLFESLELGEVNRAVRTQNLVSLTELGPEQTTALGKALGVQALLMGSVMEFDERRTGTVALPDIAISLRMIDVETGVAIWAVTDARAGAKLSTRLFGIGEESQTEATVRLVRDVLETLE